MKQNSIKISDDVLTEIQKEGKFGDTVDDVLRRLLGMELSLTTLKRMRTHNKSMSDSDRQRLEEAYNN